MLKPEFATYEDKNGAFMAPFLLHICGYFSVYKALEDLRLCTYFDMPI